jgi:hypothetical protein
VEAAAAAVKNLFQKRSFMMIMLAMILKKIMAVLPSNHSQIIQ